MRMRTNTIAPLLIAVGVGAPAPAIANLQPGSFITQGGIEITPTLKTGVSSNSNFFRTPTNEESRLIWTITPNVVAAIKDGLDSYKLHLSTSSSLHNKDTTDNFTETNLGAGMYKELTSKHRLHITGDADWLYEPRGSGLNEGLGDTTDELVKYERQDVTARYEYGARSSKAQVALTAGFTNREYQNFRAVSQYRDYDKTLLGITGYYNTQAATRTFIELREQRYRYDILQANGISRDSDDLRLLLGMEWIASSVTSGTFKLGYQNKDFSSELRENFTGLSWEAAVDWQPLSYSSIEIVTSRAAKDPLVIGDFIKESIYGVNWDHNWSDYFSTLASLKYIDEQYTGSTGRKDETKSLRLGVNYLVNHFGMVSSYIDYFDRDSTQNNIVFDRVVVGLNFTFALKANR